MGDVQDRRAFLRATTALGGGLIVAEWANPARSQQIQPAEEDISANEDLMREHGVLRRVLLVYEAAIGRAPQTQLLDTDVIRRAATIVRDFIENYHEKLEEEFLFPRFRQEKLLTDLVAVLLRQHEAGRQVTARILALTAGARVVPASDNQPELRERIGQFITMYRPHAAREDTVLFPANHHVFGARQYDELGDKLEERERAQFGHHGFEQYVKKVSELESQVGINDLTKFTPAL